MSKRFTLLAAALAALSLPLHAADQPTQPTSLTLGFVAKANSNPVFQAARVGAEDAAKEFGKQYGVTVTIDWRTPDDENAQKQADAIEQMTISHVDGIAVSCSDANKVTSAIDNAVKNGIPVVTFDSDAPASKRFAYYGTDDYKCGVLLMDELGKQMNGEGVVAILAGNPNAPNLQTRARAVKEEAAKKFPKIKILDVYNHKETPEDAAAEVNSVMLANPEITGWAMIGGWPLFTSNALKWTPGTVKCVAVDALPAQLAYIKSGHVPVLLAQQCYEWGHTSVKLLLDKILHNKTPPQPFVDSPLLVINKDNVDEYAKNWDKWLPKK